MVGHSLKARLPLVAWKPPPVARIGRGAAAIGMVAA